MPLASVSRSQERSCADVRVSNVVMVTSLSWLTPYFVERPRCSDEQRGTSSQYSIGVPRRKGRTFPKVGNVIGIPKGGQGRGAPGRTNGFDAIIGASGKG